MFLKNQNEISNIWCWLVCKHSSPRKVGLPFNFAYDVFFYMEFLDLFLLNLLGCHWLIIIYKFQVCIFIIQHLYILLCAHHPESSLLPLPCICPFTLFIPPPPFPLVITILLSVRFIFSS